MTTTTLMMTSCSGREGSQNLLLWESSQRKTGIGLVPCLPYHRLGPDLRGAPQGTTGHSLDRKRALSGIRRAALRAHATANGRPSCGGALIPVM